MINREPPTAEIDVASIQTYRYVRAAIIGAVLLLFLAVVLQIIADGGAIRSSISEYYYGPVRSVFVGTLVATGLALVAIKGRPVVEEIALNLAGMLAPVVAFVPTPVPASDGLCREGAKRCIGAEFLPGVENNVAALILIGLPVLVLAWWTVIRSDVPNRATRLSLTGATVVWAGFAIWFFWGPRDPFLETAHYVAALSMFGLIVVVVWYNALRTDHAFQMAGRFVSYRVIYRIIAGFMAVVLLMALVYYWASAASSRPDFPVVFVLEAVLLVLFTTFWLAQTLEFWDEGLPREARCQTQPPR